MYVVILFLLLLTCIAVVDAWWTTKKDLVEGLTATDQDMKDAQMYALKSMCEGQGFTFSTDDDGKWLCSHNATSCLAASAYPSVTAANSPVHIDQPYLEWNTDVGKCIFGMESFRKQCEGLGMSYDASRGRCNVTKKYCNCHLLSYKDGDCWEDPITKGIGYIFGETLSKAMTGPLNPASYQCAIERAHS